MFKWLCVFVVIGSLVFAADKLDEAMKTEEWALLERPSRCFRPVELCDRRRQWMGAEGLDRRRRERNDPKRLQFWWERLHLTMIWRSWSTPSTPSLGQYPKTPIS